MKTKTKASQLFQIFDHLFQDEKFCIHAVDQQDAEHKLFGWLQYRGTLDRDSLNQFSVTPVDVPKYTDNIHDEWVD